MTPDARYEIRWIKDDMTDVDDSTSLKAVALDSARKASQSASGYTYYVYDRMARNGSTCRWDFRAGALINTEVK